MIKRLRKVGNSHAIILDKPLMELIGLREGGEVNITVDHGSLVISPTDPSYVGRERAMNILDELMDERDETYRRLAQ